MLDHDVWLFPAAVALHFTEEWLFGFANWARRHLSPAYSEEHWRRIHSAGMVLALVSSAAVALWPNRSIAFGFTAIIVAPMAFNAVFHVTASIVRRSYSPGTLTAVTLFPAILARLVAVSPLDPLGAAAAIAIGAVMHGADLATTTFFERFGTNTTFVARCGGILKPASSEAGHERRAP